MTDRRPFDKEKTTKIPFSELIELINQKCDYRFAIIDNEVDEELMALAKKEGIDLTGYKHVIETSGTSHSRNRHGENSKDRMPLAMEDYFLIPLVCYRGGCHAVACPLRLDNPLFFYPFPRPTICKNTTFP